MGLTVHYSLQLNTRSATKARQAIEALRSRALGLPLKTVGDIIDLSGDAADWSKLPKHDPNGWLLIQAQHHWEEAIPGQPNRRYCYSVPPSRVIAFSTEPGDGCEQANFGLAQYPAHIEIDGKRHRTRAKGWGWSSFCKTQYASNPECGGVENFLKCHMCVTAMLDAAKALGILAEVRDEGDYWQKRDMKALAEEVGEWNVQIAGSAGRLKDMIGKELEAPILKFPDFEHLEADGRARDAG